MTESRIGSPAWRVAGVGCLVASFIVCYGDVIQTLVGQWISMPMYSYGFLIPILSLYFVWLRRERLSQLDLAPSYAIGALVLCASLALLEIGRAIGVVAIQEVSMLVTIVGLVVLVLGPVALRALWFPIAYLALMLPIWDVLTERLHLPFQLLSARIGAGVLGALSVPVFRESVYLQLPNITLEVAEICSGVNYLIAVVAVGMALAYLSLGSGRNRALLIAFAMGVAIGSNGIRVAMVGLSAHYGMSEFVHGPGHMFQGLFVTMVGYAALLVGVSFLARRERRQSSCSRAASGPAAATGPVRRALWPATALAAIVLLVAASFTGARLSPRLDRVPHLPASVGEWTSSTAAGFAEQFAELEWARRIQAYGGTGGEVVVILGTYAVSVPAKGPLRYSTDELEAEARTRRVGLESETAFSARQSALQRPAGDVRVTYWYDIGGQVVADRRLAKVYAAWHALTGRGIAPFVVMVAWQEASNDPIEDTFLSALRRELRTGKGRA